MHNVDIKENEIFNIDKRLLEIILLDRTTKNNLIWATDNYAYKGIGFKFFDEITLYSIIKKNGSLIKPRVVKSQKEQNKRIKEKAEVFTPSWICNEQNNLIDSAWFGRENVFNVELEKSWKTNTKKIIFCDKKWEDYVKLTRLEVSCGEAPYLTSRYDTVNGNYIEVRDRIGLFDRKLRVINENVDNKNDWFDWTLIALKNIYGYDWQGDNVLLARENLLETIIEFYYDKFSEELDLEFLLKAAEIVSWNIWQMDGQKYVIPNSCKTEEEIVLTFFGEEHYKIECKGCKNNNPHQHNGIYCKIMDWEKNKAIKFVSLIKGGYRW